MGEIEEEKNKNKTIDFNILKKKASISNFALYIYRKLFNLMACLGGSFQPFHFIFMVGIFSASCNVFAFSSIFVFHHCISSLKIFYAQIEDVAKI